MTAPSDRVAKILALPDPHAWTGSVPSWLGDPSQRGIGQFIDHTLLKAEAMPSEIDHAAQVARELGTATVCINGRWVERVRKALEGSTVKTCAVVGFPLGAMASSVKADEARQAIDDGAAELDMVMSLGEAKAGHWDLVAKDIAAVITAAGKVPVKVILETALLGPAEIVQASLVAVDAGAAFVKTSSGFHGGGGAMEPAVRLMRRAVGANVRGEGVGRRAHVGDGDPVPGGGRQPAGLLGHGGNDGDRGPGCAAAVGAVREAARPGTGAGRVLEILRCAQDDVRVLTSPRRRGPATSTARHSSGWRPTTPETDRRSTSAG